MRAPVEHDAGDEDQHREHEVAHDETGLEVVEHGEAAEQDLRDDAERQQHREPHQVAAVGPPAIGAQQRRERREADEAGQQPVAELDHAVRVELAVERRLGALRPCRAAEPRPGDADRDPRHHDQRERNERHAGDQRIAGGGDDELQHSAQKLRAPYEGRQTTAVAAGCDSTCSRRGFSIPTSAISPPAIMSSPATSIPR